MENTKNIKTRSQLLDELNKNNEFTLALESANKIKKRYDLDLDAYFEFIELMRQLYIKSYRQGVESSKLIYGVGEYEKMKF